jgi:hypothetical protein
MNDTAETVTSEATQRTSRPRPPSVRDVACPACGAPPWTACEGGRSHRRRFAVARRLRRELGFPQPRVLQDEYGHFRKAKV